MWLRMKFEVDAAAGSTPGFAFLAMLEREVNWKTPF
jgi:hypothetical protein